MKVERYEKTGLSGAVIDADGYRVNVRKRHGDNVSYHTEIWWESPGMIGVHSAEAFALAMSEAVRIAKELDGISPAATTGEAIGDTAEFDDWLNREDYGDREQLARCWEKAQAVAKAHMESEALKTDGDAALQMINHHKWELGTAIRVRDERIAKLREKLNGYWEAFGLAREAVIYDKHILHILSDAMLIPESFVYQLADERKERENLIAAAVTTALDRAAERVMVSEGMSHCRCGLGADVKPELHRSDCRRFIAFMCAAVIRGSDKA